jgi:hypothetical protein
LTMFSWWSLSFWLFRQNPIRISPFPMRARLNAQFILLRPPLLSSGQSSWSGFDSRRYQIF